jgi:hypothetical protein
MSAVRKVCAGVALAGSVALLGLAGLTDPGVPAQAAVQFTRTVAVPLAAPEASRLRACEDAITTAVMQGAVPTSGEYSPAMRRECRRLTRKQGRAAELWTERMETLFES